MSCTLGDECAVAGVIEQYVISGDAVLGQRARSSHIDRATPFGITPEPF
jgi:hypothetical protein